MNSRILLIFGVLTLAAGWLPGQTPFAPEPGVLVLRSGQILHGQIMRQGDSYQVMIAEGSEIRVPGADVRLHARSLEEAYLAQRDSLSPTDLAGRLQLANWCLRAEMPHRAADQLLAVRLYDSAHKGLPAVERRLAAWEMARRAAQATQAEVERAEEAAAAKNPYDTSELDKAVASLPTELVESFAQRVQPLLVNRCGASGCHGFGSKTEFQLLRPSFHSTFTQRYTQRNLVAALGQIEKTLPEKSPLLERAVTLHGGETAPVLVDRRDQQNELLRGWVLAVCGGKTASQTDAVPETIKPPQVKPETKQLLQNQQQAASQRTSGRGRDVPMAGTYEVQPSNFHDESPQPIADRAKSSSLEHSGDPADPSVFNRRYHGRR